MFKKIKYNMQNVLVNNLKMDKIKTLPVQVNFNALLTVRIFY